MSGELLIFPNANSRRFIELLNEIDRVHTTLDRELADIERMLNDFKRHLRAKAADPESSEQARLFWPYVHRAEAALVEQKRKRNELRETIQRVCEFAPRNE